MKKFEYYMPTKTVFGRGCVLENKELLIPLGKKAMIVTGKNSAKKNGAEKDVTDALDQVGISWIVFNEIMENPDVTVIEKAARIAKKEAVDFIIGIGGGSPMDASKAIGVLVANPEAPTEILFENAQALSVPIVALPTTAGTGSEVTDYSIVTIHEKRTKMAITPKIFPLISFLDGKYMDELPAQITNNTAIDALTHLIESYLSVKSDFLSEQIVESGLHTFRECIPALESKVYTKEDRDNLLFASYMAGIAIAQAGTSLPHGLGYFLTYEKGIPHGRANALVTQAYLELFPENHKKVSKLLDCLGMNSIQELGLFLDRVLDTTEQFTKEEVQYYTERAMETPQKLLTFPYPLTKEDIFKVYEKSLL